MKYYIKIVTGFRKDQELTVDADEAHKAYYLFHNPAQRGVFNNGLAIKGDQIQRIEPDYNATMGWYASHTLDSDDWADIRAKGIEKRIMAMLEYGKELAQRGDTKNLSIPLTELRAIEKKETKQIPGLSDEMKKLYERKRA